MAFLTALGGFAWEASAAPDSLRERLQPRAPAFRRDSTPPIGRYVTEDGRAFVFDRSTSRPLLKFENSYEVWALQPQAAPRGDIIYKNDLGQPVLRATRLGGLTLFSASNPGGSAAALSGGGTALRLPVLGPQALLEKLAQASARASRAARRLIPFDADADPSSAALVADAAMITSEAVVRISRQADGRARLAQVKKVQLVQGNRAAATLSNDVMRITVAPGQGLAGRPSSDRIAFALGVR
ncbi:MAG TPA: DUF4908 domain-containing protein [Thermoanaerobaculia bacterium]|nr:DUF4908 domain-containing protein [Thermoanaerobaculia bacterium]